MVDSEGARRGIALCTVIAGVVVQTVATRPADADQASAVQTFGVRLFESSLTAPTMETATTGPTFELSALEADLSVAASVERRAITFELSTAAEDVDRQRPWVPAEPAATTNLQDWPERRDSNGAILELSENDVLIPVRTRY